MKLRIEAPAECIYGDSEERRELIELLYEWDLTPEDYLVIHVDGNGVVPDRCFVDVDTNGVVLPVAERNRVSQV